MIVRVLFKKNLLTYKSKPTLGLNYGTTGNYFCEATFTPPILKVNLENLAEMRRFELLKAI